MGRLADGYRGVARRLPYARGLSAAWVLIWAVWFRDHPNACRSVTQAELAGLVITGKEKAKAPWGRLIPAMLPPAIVYLCLGATFWTWRQTYFARSYHLVLKDSAIFTFGVLFAGVFGGIGGGWLSDPARGPRTKWLLMQQTGRSIVSFPM
jgi:hypothetical protein